MNFNTIILFPRPSVYDENTNFSDAFLKLGEKKEKQLEASVSLLLKTIV